MTLLLLNKTPKIIWHQIHCIHHARIHYAFLLAFPYDHTHVRCIYTPLHTLRCSTYIFINIYPYLRLHIYPRLHPWIYIRFHTFLPPPVHITNAPHIPLRYVAFFSHITSQSRTMTGCNDVQAGAITDFEASLESPEISSSRSPEHTEGLPHFEGPLSTSAIEDWSLAFATSLSFKGFIPNPQIGISLQNWPRKQQMWV